MSNFSIDDGWTPTAENINALPDPLRRYIHDLETNCDPSGMVRENVLTCDENKSLRTECKNIAASNTALLNALEALFALHDPEGRFAPSHFKPILKQVQETIAAAKSGAYQVRREQASITMLAALQSINKIIFARGAPKGSSTYFAIRQFAVEGIKAAGAEAE